LVVCEEHGLAGRIGAVRVIREVKSGDDRVARDVGIVHEESAVPREIGMESQAEQALFVSL